jgi:cysteine-rich secretory family protein
MRVSACATVITALLATDVAAWSSYRNWKWSSNTGTQAQAQNQNQNGGTRPKNFDTDCGTDYPPAATPAAPANDAAPVVPDAEPTTLIRITSTPPAPAAPAATPAAPADDAPADDAPADDAPADDAPADDAPADDAPADDAPADDAPAADAPASGSSSGLSSDAQKALDAHNAARSEVNHPALSWDDGLEADALAWAQNLANIGSLTHSSGTGQGENLYMSFGRSGGNHLTSASDLWIAEKADYNGERIGEGNFASYGHYSEFAPEAHLGCSRLTHHSSGRLEVHHQGRHRIGLGPLRHLRRGPLLAPRQHVSFFSHQHRPSTITNTPYRMGETPF